MKLPLFFALLFTLYAATAEQERCRGNRIEVQLPAAQGCCFGLVQGQILVGETSSTILHGTGFTVTQGSSGGVQVTLTDPALINPTVTATSDLAGFGAFVVNQSGSSFEIVTGTGGVVNFIATGPCPPSTNPP